MLSNENFLFSLDTLLIQHIFFLFIPAPIGIIQMYRKSLLFLNLHILRCLSCSLLDSCANYTTIFECLGWDSPSSAPEQLLGNISRICYSSCFHRLIYWIKKKMPGFAQKVKKEIKSQLIFLSDGQISKIALFFSFWGTVPFAWKV